MRGSRGRPAACWKIDKHFGLRLPPIAHTGPVRGWPRTTSIDSITLSGKGMPGRTRAEPPIWRGSLPPGVADRGAQIWRIWQLTSEPISRPPPAPNRQVIIVPEQWPRPVDQDRVIGQLRFTSAAPRSGFIIRNSAVSPGRWERDG
jgi:hypothetical protein